MQFPVSAMTNPWKKISLSDYESHMSLDTVRQLQALNELMEKQFSVHPAKEAMILGVAGGNGLEHVNPEIYEKVYGIDINEKYLETVRERYPELDGILELITIDVISESEKLPEAELVIANLFVEFVGTEVFTKSIQKTGAKYVSCIIQVNMDDEKWISDTPYAHAFHELNKVHSPVDDVALTEAMKEIGYRMVKSYEYFLPNDKKFIMLDFKN